MKTVNWNSVRMEDCLRAAQKEDVVVLKNGRPLAVVLSVEGLDREQVELGMSDRFWRFIQARRESAKHKTYTHEEVLEIFKDDFKRTGRARAKKRITKQPKKS